MTTVLDWIVRVSAQQIIQQCYLLIDATRNLSKVIILGALGNNLIRPTSSTGTVGGDPDTLIQRRASLYINANPQ